MPYLSEIQHRRVIEPNGNEIGTLKDLAVVPHGQFPAVQWAILATGDGERVVKWSDIAQEIEFVAGIREGLAELDRGEHVTADALRERIGAWTASK